MCRCCWRGRGSVHSCITRLVRRCSAWAPRGPWWPCLGGWSLVGLPASEPRSVGELPQLRGHLLRIQAQTRSSCDSPDKATVIESRTRVTMMEHSLTLRIDVLGLRRLGRCIALELEKRGEDALLEFPEICSPCCLSCITVDRHSV